MIASELLPVSLQSSSQPLASHPEPLARVQSSAMIVSAFEWSDVEDARLSLARRRIPTVADLYSSLAFTLSKRLAETHKTSDRELIVAASATALWQHSIRDVQRGVADDRSLYWGRLAQQQSIRRKVDAPDYPSLAAISEQYSRGLTAKQFPAHARTRILITGFDPFHLDHEITQSNPSGLAALSLNGVTLELDGRKAHVETALIPVRFGDFDNGLIEDFLTACYHDISLLITISMGRDEFDLERFPGRCRSAESPDNCNVFTGANPNNPLPPMLRGKPLNGPEFVEFSLPAATMCTAKGDWDIRDNRQVQTLESGPIEAPNLARIINETAVRGSGGGYLSNEISYRSIFLRNNLGLSFPIGHIHTPSVRGYQQDQERRIVMQLRRMVERALGDL